MDPWCGTAHVLCMCDVNLHRPLYACLGPPRRSSAPAEPYTLRVSAAPNSQKGSAYLPFTWSAGYILEWL